MKKNQKLPSYSIFNGIGESQSDFKALQTAAKMS